MMKRKLLYLASLCFLALSCVEKIDDPGKKEKGPPDLGMRKG